MTEASDYFYAFFPGDYNRDTTMLTLTEHGAYRVLLDTYYAEQGLPADKERLYTICRVRNPQDKDAVDFVVDKYFRPNGSRLVNKRAERQIAYREQCVDYGKKGGEASVATRSKRYGTAIPMGARNHPDKTTTEGSAEGPPHETATPNKPKGLPKGPTEGSFEAKTDTSISISKEKKRHTPPHEDRAVYVVKYYEEIIREDRPSRARAIRNVTKILNKGIDYKVMMACVNLYADDAEKTEPKYRKVAGNFFGRDEIFKSYIDEAIQNAGTTLPFVGKEA